MLVYINACSTAVIGQLLIDNHVPAAIVTLRSLEDGVAWPTASTFYRMLIRLGDLRAAYNASRPAADGRYLWLSNGGYADEMAKQLMDKLTVMETVLTESKLDRSSMHLELGKQVKIITVTAILSGISILGLAVHSLLAVIH